MTTDCGPNSDQSLPSVCSCELSAGSASTHGAVSDFSCGVVAALRAGVATSDLGLTEVTLPPRVVGEVVERRAAGPETGRDHVDGDSVCDSV